MDACNFQFPPCNVVLHPYGGKEAVGSTVA